MKTKTIIGMALAVSILQTSVFAADITSYDHTKNDNPYFVERESIITLNANGGQIGSGQVGSNNIQRIETENGKIKLPLPYRDSDHEFLGWYTEEGDKVSSDTEYYEDATLYAEWEITGKRTITFASDGGTDILPITVKYGETVNVENQVPIKTGFAFKGWYKDPVTKENRVTEIRMDEDVNLYAKWEQKSRRVNTLGKDHIYLTDEEIAVRREQAIEHCANQQTQPKVNQLTVTDQQPVFTQQQINILLQLIRQLLPAYL